MNEKQISRNLYIAQQLLRTATRELYKQGKVEEGVQLQCEDLLEDLHLDIFLTGSEEEVEWDERLIEVIQIERAQ